jgi:hypothetical protein
MEADFADLKANSYSIGQKRQNMNRPDAFAANFL